MSTPTERGAEELDRSIGLGPNFGETALRAVVDSILTAALTDPDDPDALARVMYESSKSYALTGGKPWPILTESSRNSFRDYVATVRAWLLGADL